MCGIYITNIPFSIRNVEDKLKTIQFRGPDYMGIDKQDDLILGHLRLSIIDLDERSNQPMKFENLSIVFNGEIYNFLSLREELKSLGYSFETSGDTEVLLKGYKEWGKELIPKLNGMFALAIYDKGAQKVFCSRDRLGVKPFYYYWNDGEFEICSQLRPISGGKKINKEAVSIYLDCTYIPSPYSIFEDVFKLPPGNNLEIDLQNNKLQTYEYWKLESVKESQLTYTEAKDHLHELLKDAVNIRLKSDVPFGTFLSGGIDSALISSIASKISKDKIKTFTIGFDNPKYDESKVAKQFANVIDSEHLETICKPEDFISMLPELTRVYDEPFGDSSALPSLLLNKVTKQYVTMALSGDGGDESFLGYNYFDSIGRFKKIFKIPYFLRVCISNLFVFNLLSEKVGAIKRLLQVESLRRFVEGIFLGYNTLLKRRSFDWLSNYSKYWNGSDNLLQKAADLNIKLWLENDSNVKVDRASMAFSVEVRSPLLDYRIIEFARTLPVNYRFDNGVKKKIIRDILKEYIPEKVFDQPKKGFSMPIGDWIRNELREEFLANLSDDFLNQVPNLHLRRFKKMLKQHLASKADYSSYIWRVYVLSKWYKEFGYLKNNQ